MIMDEVITGWGRTGAKFGIDHWGVVPDFICAAKGMAGGYVPLGATIIHGRVVKALESSGRSMQGYTYGGNPLSCAGGDAVLSYIHTHNLIDRSARVGAEMKERAQVLLDLPIVGDVRGWGTLLGVEYVADRETREPFGRELHVAERIRDVAFNNGLTICPITGFVDGIRGDVSVLSPPFTTPSEDITNMLDILEGAIREVQKEVMA
jgi:adenosylmethionine-8-amino-7-oxononanoate aminotransferase